MLLTDRAVDSRTRAERWTTDRHSILLVRFLNLVGLVSNSLFEVVLPGLPVDASFAIFSACLKQRLRCGRAVVLSLDMHGKVVSTVGGKLLGAGAAKEAAAAGAKAGAGVEAGTNAASKAAGPVVTDAMKAQVRTVAKSLKETGKPPQGIQAGKLTGYPRGVFANSRNKLPQNSDPHFYKESDLWPPNGFKANGKPQRVEGRVVVGGDRVWYTEHYQTFTEIID